MSATVETLDDVDMTDAEEDICTKGMIFQIMEVRQRKLMFFDVLGKKKSVTLGNPQATDADGLLIDVDVQLVNDNPSTYEDKRQDVDNFFRATIVKDVNGKSKKYRVCKLCP
jgi:hypothetical protein